MGIDEVLLKEDVEELLNRRGFRDVIWCLVENFTNSDYEKIAKLEKENKKLQGKVSMYKAVAKKSGEDFDFLSDLLKDIDVQIRRSVQ